MLWTSESHDRPFSESQLCVSAADQVQDNVTFRRTLSSSEDAPGATTSWRSFHSLAYYLLKHALRQYKD
jgi:hypothetical protein